MLKLKFGRDIFTHIYTLTHIYILNLLIAKTNEELTFNQKQHRVLQGNIVFQPIYCV